ncbi:DUF418 domain-containing protein [Bacillus massiliglaciei]|uniref:DUF418 domain-containing protein n=1 Tax=Bacillus massiliglaciei TaxID=1816693 RepID=UPI000ACC9D36|nr:DUF418 domain-containing protein [Bacillus massiliglaciei]
MEKSERIAVIDILRGLAILGIFMVNMPSFYTPINYMDGYDRWTSGSDRYLYIFTDIFAQASFYPLFAFLFGFGAVILCERTVQKGKSFPFLFSKRLFALLVIGCLHAFFVWHGDILITYALLGFIFLFFYKMGGRALLWIGSLLYLIPNGLLALGMLAVTLFEPSLAVFPTDQDMVRQSMETYSAGTFMEIMRQRISDWYYVNNGLNAPFLFLSIFPLFLIGAGFAKLQWLNDIQIHRKKLAVLVWAGLFLGLVFKCFPYLTAYNAGTMYVQEFGGPFLSIGYIGGIALLFQKKQAALLLRPLGSVGRMSLSNYLFQSLLCSFLFYSYGLGLYGKISYTAGFLLLVGIYAVQVFLSERWLRKFRFGPAEYMWRLAYGNTAHMQRKKAG